MSGLLPRLYRRLLEAYGPRGWWPLASRAGRPGFDAEGYHPGIYDLPAGLDERFEIAAGAVLTQNTSWRNASRAVAALLADGIRTPEDVLDRPEKRLAQVLRSSGCYNQKARKLRALSGLLAAFGADGERGPSREELLAVWGIGPETADSILLYAWGRPFFVVDAYTGRLLERLGVAAGGTGYARLQALFQDALPADAVAYQEFHALIVHHAKLFCRRRPGCPGCPLLTLPCPRAAAD